VHQEPGSVPGLQGEPEPRTGERFEFMQRSWSPAARVTAGVAGGTLAIGGLLTRGVVGAALGLAGMALSTRALTNLELKRLVGIGAGRFKTPSEHGKTEYGKTTTDGAVVTPGDLFGGQGYGPGTERRAS
jgi:hypothetical protein